MGRVKRITLKDVAERASVHTMAASVVLNGARSNTGVSDETRRRIEHAAMELGYRPNLAAQALRTGLTNTIGILTPRAQHVLRYQYYATIADAIIEEAAILGQSVTFFNSIAWSSTDPGKTIFAEGRCDGLLVIGVPEPTLLPDVARARVPCVWMHNGVMPCGHDSIDIDNRHAANVITKHLIEAGHRRIAYIHGGESVNFTVERCLGYRQAHVDAGLPVDERLEFPCNSILAEAYQTAQRVASDRSLGVTGIVCASDFVALGVLHGLRDAGVSVPDDISVVGIDGLEDGRTAFPPLTTMDQSLDSIGADATRILMNRIARPDEPTKHTSRQAVLTIRASVGPARAR